MESEKQKILIVDDDPSILNLLKRAILMWCDQMEVATAENGEHALEILGSEKIFMVVTDIKMPGISGLHLLAKIRDKYPPIDVILMTGFYTDKIRKEVRESGCLHFLKKPFDPEQLIRLLRDRVANEKHGFQGTLKNIQLTDLIQMCCMAGISMVIKVAQSHAGGIIYIHNGNIVHAQCVDTLGEEAFYKILAWESGSFETLSMESVPAATIDKSFQYLLLESLRKVDEQESSSPGEDESLSDEFQLELLDDTIRVMIVDDSPMMCKMLTRILKSADHIDVIGTANNGRDALEKIKDLSPDLITLDVNMPVMDGTTALKHIMIKNPCPVVIISSLGSGSLTNIMDFLQLGAVDYITKPKSGHDSTVNEATIVSRIQLAAKANISHFQRPKALKVLNQETLKNTGPCKQLVIVGSGVGGYAELIKIIASIPRDSETCVLFFHDMPQDFVAPMAAYLNQRSPSRVEQLSSNSPLSSGRCYIGSHELLVDLKQNQGDPDIFMRINDTVPESNQTGLNHFLNQSPEVFAGQIIVMLLSGAHLGDLSGLNHVSRNKGRIFTQSMNTCMIPYTLEGAVKAGLVENQISYEDLFCL